MQETTALPLSAISKPFSKISPVAQRSQIYRTIVESSLKVDDYARATDYAERMVALRPDDASINVLAIQLLERNGDAAGWRRAISYCTRVLDLIDRTSVTDKSPRESAETWANDKNRDKASLLLARGRLYQKLNDLQNAQKDYEGKLYAAAIGNGRHEVGGDCGTPQGSECGNSGLCKGLRTGGRRKRSGESNGA